MTSSGMKKVSPMLNTYGKSSVKSKSTRPSTKSNTKTSTKTSTKGHLYEFLGTKNGKNAREVTITLMDWTLGEELKLAGTVKLENKYTVTTINEIEGHKNVYLRLHDKGGYGKVENTKGVGWTLSPI